MKHQQGFTLIEVMIVVAIIAILAAIAIPAYQLYATRSQIAAALAEISGGKSPFESELITESAVATTPEEIGLKGSTTRCTTTIDSGAQGYIRCKMKGSPTIDDKTLTLQRTADSAWRCVVQADIPTRYWPDPCS